MQKRVSISILRFLLAFAPCLALVYLVWIGAQYLIEDKVVFGAVDICVACTLAWYAARDVLAIDERLQRAASRSV